MGNYSLIAAYNMKKRIIASLFLSFILTSFLGANLFVGNTPVVNPFFWRTMARNLNYMSHNASLAFQEKFPQTIDIKTSKPLDPDIVKIHTGEIAERPKVIDEEVAIANQYEKRLTSFAPADKKQILLQQGFAYESAGEREKAEAKYKLVIEMDPKDTPTYLKLANNYIEMGNVDKAITTYREAMGANPEDNSAALALAKTYRYEKKTPTLAIPVYVAEANKKPQDVDIKFLLALTYIDAGQKEAARTVLQQILHIDPGNTAAARQLQFLH